MWRLYVDYGLLPVQIARVYEVTKEKVNQRRYKWDNLLSDQPPDPETVSDVLKLLDAHEKAVLKEAERQAPPFECRYRAASGTRWVLSLKDGWLLVTGTPANSNDTALGTSIRQEAEILMARCMQGRSDIPFQKNLQHVYPGYAKVAASSEANPVDPSGQFADYLDDQEALWLAGSLRIALSLWPAVKST